MNAPPELNNPHLPLTHVPSTLDAAQITDLCNYTALRAVAYELSKVYDGYYTWFELGEAVDRFAAHAAHIATERWPTYDQDTRAGNVNLTPDNDPDRMDPFGDTPRALDDTQLIPVVAE